MDKALLDLLPYELKDLTAALALPLGTSPGVTDLDATLVAAGALEAVYAAIQRRLAADPWLPADSTVIPIIGARSSRVTLAATQGALRTARRAARLLRALGRSWAVERGAGGSLPSLRPRRPASSLLASWVWRGACGADLWGGPRSYRAAVDVPDDAYLDQFTTPITYGPGK